MFRRRVPLTPARRLARLLWPSMGLVRSGRYVAYRVARIQGSPHSIALGIAWGVAVAMTPLLGLHFPIAFVLAWASRASIMGAMVGTVTANPWTFPAIWYSSYRLGCTLLGMAPGHDDQARLTLAFLLDHPWQVFLPMLAGGALLGLGAGVIAYAVAKPVIQFYQEKRRERRRAVILLRGKEV
ncbi:DUF2062 domain-containing protein [Niveispirillum sp. KHB5.9]|uniref:DUF2062 domain-containing protein n=1 Tax=Niveispirillum sp. KHB5.9 TaxID=3400269 RepID=UPI003A87DC92